MAGPPPVKPVDRPFTMPALWRLAPWGGSAAIALTLVVLVQASENGRQQMAHLLGREPPTRLAAVAPPPPPPPRDTEAEAELRRQSETLRLLAADRERLAARLAELEAKVEDVTGSVRQVAERKPAIELPAVPAWLTAPQILAPATTEAAPARPRLSARQPQVEMPPADTIAVKTEFGIDLGTAAHIEGLRGLWNAAKLSHPAVLEALRPVLGLREQKGRPVEMRLIAGPVANAGVAARLCATLVAAGTACQPAVFDGQRLALH